MVIRTDCESLIKLNAVLTGIRNGILKPENEIDTLDSHLNRLNIDVSDLPEATRKDVEEIFSMVVKRP